MELQELGKSGIRISSIGLGTWQWGSREWGWGGGYGKKEVLEATRKAIELGINFIDTAEMYGRGMSEKIIAEAIRGRREDVVVATKISPWNLSYGRVLRAADRSLQRLGIDVIDLYQVHWPNPIIPIHNTMKALRKLVEAGKVRCIGVSNFNLKRLKAAQALGPLELASNQVKYNLLDREIEAELLPYTQKENITIIAYSPLAQGLLTGKYAANSTPSSSVQYMSMRFSKRNLEQLTPTIRSLSEIATAHGKTPSQVALNWLITKQNVVAIPGAKRPENVVDNAGAAGWRLDAGEVAELESVVSAAKFDRLSGIPNLLKALTHM